MDDHPTAYTYDQAAAALGIHPEAVRARLRRNALRRGPPGNDGRPTVLLSTADIATVRAASRAQPVKAGPGAAPEAAVRPDERDRTIKALEGEAATLRDALTRERERAGRAAARAEAIERRLEEERQSAAAETAKLREEREAARIAAAAAEGEVKGLREEADRLREREAGERGRAEAAEEALEELREAREEARLQAARAEEKAEGLRLALEEARRPFWRRWIG